MSTPEYQCQNLLGVISSADCNIDTGYSPASLEESTFEPVPEHRGSAAARLATQERILSVGYGRPEVQAGESPADHALSLLRRGSGDEDQFRYDKREVTSPTRREAFLAKVDAERERLFPKTAHGRWRR